MLSIVKCSSLETGDSPFIVLTSSTCCRNDLSVVSRGAAAFLPSQARALSHGLLPAHLHTGNELEDETEALQLDQICCSSKGVTLRAFIPITTAAATFGFLRSWWLRISAIKAPLVPRIDGCRSTGHLLLFWAVLCSIYGEMFCPFILIKNRSSSYRKDYLKPSHWLHKFLSDTQHVLPLHHWFRWRHSLIDSLPNHNP